MRHADPREYDSRQSWALACAEADVRAVRVRQGGRIAWVIMALVVASIAVACRAREMVVIDCGSMRGWIRPGGGVYDVEPVRIEDVRVGDVVVYRHSKVGLVAHRVIEVRVRRVGGKRVVRLWTKGDSVGRPDNEWVTEKNLIGIIRK